MFLNKYLSCFVIQTNIKILLAELFVALLIWFIVVGVSVLVQSRVGVKWLYTFRLF